MRMVLLSLPFLAAASASLDAAPFPASGHRVTRSLATAALEKAKTVGQTQREMAVTGGFGDTICGRVKAEMAGTDDAGTDVGLNMTMECSFTADSVTISFVASADPPVCEEGFCIDGGSGEIIVPFDLEGDVIVKICAHYTESGEANKKFNIADKTVCFSATMSLKHLMEATEDTEVMIKACTASVGDEDCSCNVCDEGIGISVKCPVHGIESDECTDLAGGDSTNGASAASIPGAQGPQVMRMAAIKEDPSAASDNGVPLVAAGFALATASLLFA